MKHFVNLIIVLSFTWLLGSCGTGVTKTGQADQAELDPAAKKRAPQVLDFPNSGEDTLKTSFFADTVIFVPLETTKDNFLTNIDQLWMSDSLIIINNQGNSLVMFGQTGKFIRKIDRKGRGPGEYRRILCFDMARDTIYLSSTGKNSFMRYTLDGIFCDEIKLNYQPNSFRSVPDQKIACYLENRGLMLFHKGNIMISPDTLVVEYGVTRARYESALIDPHLSYLQKTSTGLLFTNYVSDTIWNISGGKKEPAFFLGKNSRLLPFDKQLEFFNGDFKRWEQTAKTHKISHIIPFESCNVILQKFWMTKKYSAIYLHYPETGELKKFETSYIYDDLVSKQKLDFIRYANSPDYLVSIIEPYNVLKDLEDLKENKATGKDVPSAQWIDQMKTVDENDNAILVLMKMKKSAMNEK